VSTAAQADALSKAANEAETAAVLKHELAKAQEEAATQVSVGMYVCIGHVCGVCLSDIGMRGNMCLHLHAKGRNVG
jgi:hypothetical protein